MDWEVYKSRASSDKSVKRESQQLGQITDLRGATDVPCIEMNVVSMVDYVALEIAAYAPLR